MAKHVPHVLKSLFQSLFRACLPVLTDNVEFKAKITKVESLCGDETIRFTSFPMHETDSIRSTDSLYLPKTSSISSIWSLLGEEPSIPNDIIDDCSTLRLSSIERIQQLNESCDRLEQLFNQTGNESALEVAAFTKRFGSAFLDVDNDTKSTYRAADNTDSTSTLVGN